MHRKAALELSINAIVVLILAITILGLGIGFIRGQFGGLTEQFGSVRAEIKDQLITKIRESGDLLVFNRAELAAAIGKREEFFIGIKNTENNPQGEAVCYTVGIKCLRALKSSNYCAFDYSRNDVVVGGNIGGTLPVEYPDYTWFEMFDKVDIKNNEVGVYPVFVQIAKATRDTYAMELQVWKDQNNADCNQASLFTPYQSKQFFVVLT